MAKAAQKLELNPSENIPYDQLVLSQTNVRRVKNGVSIEELAEDIGRRRLILSLNVRPVLDDDGKETGTFEVPAGGRRFMALGILIKQKKMAKNALVPCIVNRNGDTLAEEDSLVENTHRADLHPLDQYRAIKRLVDLGLDDHEEIAARLLLTPTIVKQRLKLAAVSPKILERFEKGEIRYDQLTRFTVTDDHARQEQVWEVVSRSNSSDPNHITRLLTETAVRGDDRRAVYVGSEAYEAAGGVILRDLFNEGSTNWFQDAPLLEQLVFDKLKVDARVIQDEGWKWVEAGISFPYGHTSGMRRIYGEPQEMSAEELERYDALNAEFEKLEAEYDEAPDYDEEVEDKLEQLEAEIERLNDRPYAYDAEQVARAGVFITLGANGQIVVERGFVRPEDEPQEEEDDEEVAESNDANGHDHGTNGVVVNGKKASGEDDDDEPEDPVIRPLPDGLIFDLTAQRTLALRNAIAGDPDVAFVAALHTFVLQTFHHSMSDSCLEVSVKESTFAGARDLKETPWAKEIAERHDAWGKELPKKRDELWDFLLSLDEASKKALFAHCVSRTLNAANEKYNRRHQPRIHADVVASTLGFDMVSAGWTPTVDNYLGKVTKARILEAVREARGAESMQLIDHLKKDRMALEAARLLDGSNWLPEPIRDAGYAVPTDAPQAEAPGEVEVDAADLPAYLTEDGEGGEENLEAAE